MERVDEWADIYRGFGVSGGILVVVGFEFMADHVLYGLSSWLSPAAFSQFIFVCIMHIYI